MSDETLESLLEKIKEEFIETLEIKVSSDESSLIIDLYFDNRVKEKIKAAIELARSNSELN